MIGLYIAGDGFAGGVTIKRGLVRDVPPILSYARGWSAGKLISYAAKRGWTVKRIANRKGNKNPNAALTPALVREIRRLNDLGFGYLWLSRWLGVTKSCVQKVVTGRTWKKPG